MTLSDFEPIYKSKFHRTSSAVFPAAFIMSDLMAVMLSFGWGFFWVRIYGFIIDYGYIIHFSSFINYWPYLPIFILIFHILSLYPGISMAPAEELKRFSLGSFIAYGGIIFSRYIEGGFDSISAAFAISCLFSTTILLLSRNAAHWMLKKTKLLGVSAVIYGAGDTGRLLADRLLDSGKAGYVPVLMLADKQGRGECDCPKEYRGIPIIYDTSLGPEIVKRFKIKMAFVAIPEMEPGKVKNILNSSVSAFRNNVIIPSFFSSTNIWMSVRDFDGILGLATRYQLKMSWNLWIKRFMDLLLVITGGAVILPALLLVALLVKISSPGPVLYKHKRIGLDGQPFYIYKFRSMVIDAEKRLNQILESDPVAKKEWEASHKIQNDPRITKLGRFLRRASIDEFPQLINILRGEMSLVGPRPVVEAEKEKYGEDFNRVFSIKPGLTGLWQVSGRSDTNYAERISYDTYYLQSWSVWLDLWILFKTFGAVARGRGAY
ncbi:MAG: undecaprenyl-phosphate galactose phosphotransferase WbaP [Spirochaetes bacterium]|nr:undecaprenyl-phosphate galactose phosphotransferase WbaP [Spirochaetota bacterium]